MRLRAAAFGLAILLLGFTPPGLAGQPLRRIRSHTLRLIAAAGPRPCVVIDVDNTLADTRYRTRAAARAFALQHPEARALADLHISQIGWNGRLTALKAGLPAATADQFQAFWDQFFWDPANFAHDRQMRSTIELVRAAKRAGAAVFYITGRDSDRKEATLQQLRQFGLPDVDSEHVLCKPPAGVLTTAFKRQSVQGLKAGGRQVAWFLTDSAADAQAFADLIPGLVVDFPVRSPRETAAPAKVLRYRYGRR